MKKITKLGIVVLTLTVVLSITMFALTGKYALYTGTVKINGEYASTDLTVKACIGATEKLPNVLTYNASDQTWFYYKVWNETSGKNITFRVDGLLANEIASYNDIPDYVSFNLTVNQSAYTIALDEGWNLISIPLEQKYDGCVYLVQ